MTTVGQIIENCNNLASCQADRNIDDVIITPASSPKVSVSEKADASHRPLVEEKVATSVGTITVYVSGERKKAAIITYHDLGLNALACFQNFFDFVDVAEVADRFCIYHVNAPGQEENAELFPDNYVYPTLDQLAESVRDIVLHFNIKNFIGFGVGAGANILCRYALRYPKVVDALILVNCSGSSTGWIEWGYQKANLFYLRSRGSMNNLTIDYLMWHNFGRGPESLYDPATLANYRDYFSKIQKPRNLAGFIDSYVKRTVLNIRREGPTLQCPVLQIVGARSPHVNETIQLNTKLDPSKSDWFKISDCGGMVLEERPDKVAEAVLLFLQGQGYLPAVSYVRWAARRPSAWTPQAKNQRSVSVFSLPRNCTLHLPPGNWSRAPLTPTDARSTPFAPPPPSAQRRAHSVGVQPTAIELAKDPLFRMFDAYQVNQYKHDKRRATLESTEEEEQNEQQLAEGVV